VQGLSQAIRRERENGNEIVAAILEAHANDRARLLRENERLRAEIANLRNPTPDTQKG
jgi:hypothetical protein